MRNKHSSLETMDQMTSSSTMAFKHPFSMVVSGPSGSGKLVWTKKLLLSSLIQPSPERIIWCFGQWQPLYNNIGRKFPQGKACRDIILNTQYMVLFNNPIDRQQVVTLARRIYLSTSAVFMKLLKKTGYIPRY